MLEEIPRFEDKNEFSNLIPAWQRCGDLLADLSKQSGILMLDLDGVVLRSRSLFEPQFTTWDMKDALQTYEGVGGHIGLSTARQEGVRTFLRSFGLRLDGPLIFEGGHVVMVGEKKEVLASDMYRTFVAKVRKELENEPFFRQSWSEVEKFQSGNPDTVVVCHGDRQWNGDYRATFWYDWRHEPTPGWADVVIGERISPRIHEIALSAGLSGDQFHIKLMRMKSGLGILRIAEQIDGVVVSKEMAAKHVLTGESLVFVADGEGDKDLELHIQNTRNGKVIALRETDDVMTPEISSFTKSADIQLANPSEFVQAVVYAIGSLSMGRVYEN